MWDTLGLWLGPAVAVVLAAIGSKWFGWFRPRLRRRIAIRRIAERLAFEDSQGYDYKRDRFLEHYLGGRRWNDEWEKSDTPDGKGGMFDSRGPAPNWRHRLARKLIS